MLIHSYTYPILFRDNAMPQFGLFNSHQRISRIDKASDPLVELNQVVDWEQFRELIDRAREKPRKSPAGAKGYDSTLLFKIIILQARLLSLGIYDKVI